jgi:hypothetical protein
MTHHRALSPFVIFPICIAVVVLTYPRAVKPHLKSSLLHTGWAISAHNARDFYESFFVFIFSIWCKERSDTSSCNLMQAVSLGLAHTHTQLSFLLSSSGVKEKDGKGTARNGVWSWKWDVK